MNEERVIPSECNEAEGPRPADDHGLFCNPRSLDFILVAQAPYIPLGMTSILKYLLFNRSKIFPLLSMKHPARILLALLALCLPATAAPPNVVMIISDDQGWTDYGFMGHPQVKTPRLDAFAAQSVVFPRGYVTSSLCCPSLAAMITGRYPHENKITSNDPPLPPEAKGKAMAKAPEFRAGREIMSRFMSEAATIPRLLAPLGYVSFQTGKWWQENFATGGFTHGMSIGDEGKGGRHGDAGLTIGRQTMQPIYDFNA